MDYLVGPQAQVVLEIKEGNGFAFASKKIIAVGTLKGIKLETKEFHPSARPQFNSELIWEVCTKYLRKLRSSNTALKLEFFSVLNNSSGPQSRDRIGYVLLNLKEAQLVRSSGINTLDSWFRLLDLKNTFQTHKPEVLLKFKIVESAPMNSVRNDGNKEDNKFEAAIHIGEGDNPLVGTPMSEHLKPLQIGPPHLCTELYELSISLFAVENLTYIIPAGKIGRPVKIHFAIFGLSVWTKDISLLQKGMNTERITFKVWSKIEFLVAYFKEFPTLLLSLYCEEAIIGAADLNLQHLSDGRKSAVINSSITIKPTSEYDSGLIDMLPTLQVGVTLLYKNDCIITKLDQESQTTCMNNPTRIDAVTNTEYPNEPFIAEESLIGDYSYTKENLIPLEEAESENISNKNTKMPEKPASSPSQKIPFKEQTDFVLRSPAPTFRLSNASANPAPDFSKEYIRDAALRACEELEDWKEKQQEMFEYELKRKSERRLKKLSSEWMKHKQALDDELRRKIEECQTLKERLTVALQDLNRRSELIAEKEEELRIAKEELDSKYTQKFQELRKASKLHEYDMEDRMNEVKAENIQLLHKLEQSEKEILRLQQALLNHNSPSISKEDANNLLSEVRALEQKLEKALESKAFFKEQWGKAVRELHRMKEQEQKQLRLQIEKNKQELQTLGLVKEISQEVGEMKKDQHVIKNMRNDLSNIISSNEPIVDVNCFSGT